MQRISSNFTLFLKIVVPIFWYVFFGLFTLFIILSDPETTPFFQNNSSKLILLGAFLLFAVLIYFTLIQLLRLDASEEGLYVSNYFKTYRYQFEDIESISEYDYLIFKVIRITMRKKTSLGKRFKILINRKFWKEFIKDHPQNFEHLIS